MLVCENKYIPCYTSSRNSGTSNKHGVGRSPISSRMGGEMGESKLGSFHRELFRMGLRGLCSCLNDGDGDDDDDGSEKLPPQQLFQRSLDLRRTTRRGGDDGVQVVFVHRSCEQWMSSLCMLSAWDGDEVASELCIASVVYGTRHSV